MREFALLEHVYAANRSLGRTVVIPPGDDMGMVRTAAGAELLVAVDQLVGGRHFDPKATPIDLVGRKAITRSLSDIAAMAARPVATLVAATLPPGYGEDNARRLFDAMRTTAEQYECPLIGGDIAFHADRAFPFVCSTTVLAEPAATAPVTRGGAQPGDRLYVTGVLGGAIGPDGLGHHLLFEPRIQAALALAESLGDRLRAMIDISDGLGRDAGHIAEMSGVCIEIEADRVPCRPGVGWKEAMSGGEDYELCFAAHDAVPDAVLGIPITAVGRVLAAENGRPDAIVIAGGQRVPATSLGWEHSDS